MKLSLERDSNEPQAQSKHRALEGQKQVEPSKQVRKQVQARFRHIERQAAVRKRSRVNSLPTPRCVDF